MKNSNWKVALIIAVGVFAIIIMCVFGVQSSQNRAISYEETVETTASDIDVQLQRRVNVLTELAEAVKSYDEHEYNTLMDVIKERGKSASTSDVENITAQINAVAESYPQLKSNENYKQYMTELSTTENLVAQYKSAYNKAIKEYKRYVRRFPTRIFLSMTGYEIVDYEYYQSDATDSEPLQLLNENSAGTEN